MNHALKKESRLTALCTLLLCIACCRMDDRECTEGVSVVVAYYGDLDDDVDSGLGQSTPEEMLERIEVQWTTASKSGTARPLGVNGDAGSSGFLSSLSSDHIELYFLISESRETLGDEVRIGVLLDGALIFRQLESLQWRTDVCNLAYGPSWCDNDTIQRAGVSLRI